MSSHSKPDLKSSGAVVDHHKPSDWMHGIHKVRSLLSYSSLASDHKLDSFFRPEFTLEDVSGFQETRHSSLDFTNNSSPEHLAQSHCDALRSDDYQSPFSGLLDLPPYSHTTPKHKASSNDIGKLVHFSHHSVGEVTYIFGGLALSPEKALRQFGIPRSVDPSRVSVHFPCDMPPYVNKDVLMSPLFARNTSFLAFNPIRSTVSDFMSPSQDDDSPNQFCEMKGTQISSHQIFFYGGYKVDVKNVYYDETSRSWIIEKTLSLNEHGYILDVRKFEFSKISILSRSAVKCEPRIGAGLCSNFSESVMSRESPCIHETSSSQDHVVNSTLDTSSISQFPLSPQQSAHIFQTLHSSPSSRASSIKILDFKNSDNNELSRNTSSSGQNGLSSPSASKDISSNSQYSHDTTKDSTKKSNLRVETDVDAKTSSLSGHKFPNVISKSNKLFQVHSSKNSPAESQTSSVHSSYSKQVRQHRSKASPIMQSENKTLTTQTSFVRLVDSDLEATESDTNTSYSYEAPKSASDDIHYDPATNKKIETAVSFEDKQPDSATLNAKTSTSISFETEGLLNAYRHDKSKQSISSVVVFIFGGFTLGTDSKGRQIFKATNELLKVELVAGYDLGTDFHPEALMYQIHPNNSIIPSPRGYFAHVLISGNVTDELCHMVSSDAKAMPILKMVGKEAAAQGSLADKYFIVHGGVDHDSQVFGDCYFYDFKTESWALFENYAFDYYNLPKQPFEDEDSSKLSLDAQTENAQVVEAELRSCHHSAVVYWEGNKECIAFLGGFSTDYLRHFDKEPYQSDKFDVSRLCKLSLSAANSNLLRIPILNVRSQMWKFKRYFYDLSESCNSECGQILSHPYMKNARLAVSAGGIHIVEKQLTIFQGLVNFVPEKKSDFGLFEDELNSRTTLLGGHFHLTFPGM